MEDSFVELLKLIKLNRITQCFKEPLSRSRFITMENIKIIHDVNVHTDPLALMESIHWYHMAWTVWRVSPV